MRIAIEFGKLVVLTVGDAISLALGRQYCALVNVYGELRRHVLVDPEIDDRGHGYPVLSTITPPSPLVRTTWALLVAALLPWNDPAAKFADTGAVPLDALGPVKTGIFHLNL